MSSSGTSGSSFSTLVSIPCLDQPTQRLSFPNWIFVGPSNNSKNSSKPCSARTASDLVRMVVWITLLTIHLPSLISALPKIMPSCSCVRIVSIQCRRRKSAWSSRKAPSVMKPYSAILLGNSQKRYCASHKKYRRARQGQSEHIRTKGRLESWINQDRDEPSARRFKVRLNIQTGIQDTYGIDERGAFDSLLDLDEDFDEYGVMVG